MRAIIFFIFGLICLGQEHSPEREKNPLAGSAEAIAAGRTLYGQVCQACHGGNAAGSERGPSLANGVFRRGSLDGELFLNIRNGIAGTQMPPFSGFKTEQIWQVVSYLRSLAGGMARTNESVSGNVAAGEALFFRKAGCANCHAVNARGGIVGPDLSGAGASSVAAIRGKILGTPVVEPGRRRGRRGASGGAVTVVTAEGKTIRGVRKSEDTFTLHLMDLTGKLHLMDKSKLRELRVEEGSVMPSFAGKLSEGEVTDLVAYLKARTGRDLGETAKAAIAGGLSYERIRNSAAEPGNWLTYWGNYQGHHFSPLEQIGLGNAKNVQMRWAAQMPGDSLIEATPIVIDGVMYTTGMPGEVFALDARTGMEIWSYKRKQKVVNPFESNRFVRGVAVLGNRVYFGTLDAAVICLDARTGLPLWEVQVADTMEGYSVTAAPLPVKDRIFVGVAGGEYGARGFLDAYDAVSGKRLWRIHTTPGPGELGNDTWKGDSWKRGGAGTWLTGSYDAELDTLYWTTGNPGPDMDGEVRKGDNLFSCSVLALDPATGKRKWHYQFTPNDTHDWDANIDVVLADKVIDGKPRKLLYQANRNGMFYALDRVTGEFLFGTPFVTQTWNKGFDEKGRPIRTPGSDSTPEGARVAPGLGGGTNWQSPSYDAATGYLYVVYSDAPQVYVRTPQEFELGKGYWGGRSMPTGEKTSAGIKAIDTATGKTVWDFPISRGSLAAGVLATKSGLLFASTSEGNFLVLEAKTGKLLSRYYTGGTIASSPMSYSVGEKQFVAVGSGGVLYSFGLPD